MPFPKVGSRPRRDRKDERDEGDYFTTMSVADSAAGSKIR